MKIKFYSQDLQRDLEVLSIDILNKKFTVMFLGFEHTLDGLDRVFVETDHGECIPYMDFFKEKESEKGLTKRELFLLEKIKGLHSILFSLDEGRVITSTTTTKTYVTKVIEKLMEIK